MRLTQFMEDHHVVHIMKATHDGAGTNFADYADFNATDPSYSPVILMKNWNEAYFTLIKGANTGTTGATTVYFQACDDASASHTTDIAFYYRVLLATDVWSAWTAVAATGQAITVGADSAWEFCVLAETVGQASTTYDMVGVRIKLDETVNAAQQGAVFCTLVGARHGQSIPATVLA